ncbi:Inner membrane protein YfdC [compost metagenome]
MEVSYLVWAGDETWQAFWLEFALPTLVGNIIGGSFIFALISHAQVRSDSGKPPSQLLKEGNKPTSRRQEPKI